MVFLFELNKHLYKTFIITRRGIEMKGKTLSNKKKKKEERNNTFYPKKIEKGITLS